MGFLNVFYFIKSNHWWSEPLYVLYSTNNILWFHRVTWLNSLWEFFGNTVKATHPNIHPQQVTQATHQHIYVHSEATVVFVSVGFCVIPDALLSWCSGWVIPKWTRWLTASDKLSARLISITTTCLASPACMIDSALIPRSYYHTYEPDEGCLLLVTALVSKL